MSNTDYLIKLFQDIVFSADELFKRFSFIKNKPTPTLVAYNVIWFTDCSWLERIQAYGQLRRWLDYSTRDYLAKYPK